MLLIWSLFEILNITLLLRSPNRVYPFDLGKEIKYIEYHDDNNWCKQKDNGVECFSFSYKSTCRWNIVDWKFIDPVLEFLEATLSFVVANWDLFQLSFIEHSNGIFSIIIP